MQAWEPVEIESIVPGLDLHWHLDRSIVQYVITKVSPHVLNQWSDIVIRNLKNWPEQTPYLALHDLSNRGVGIAYATQVQFDILNLAIRPAARDKAEDLIANQEGMKATVALLFNSFHSGYVGQTFARLSGSKLSLVKYEAFYDRVAALDWLKERRLVASEEEKE